MSLQLCVWAVALIAGIMGAYARYVPSLNPPRQGEWRDWYWMVWTGVVVAGAFAWVSQMRIPPLQFISQVMRVGCILACAGCFVGVVMVTIVPKLLQGTLKGKLFYGAALFFGVLAWIIGHYLKKAGGTIALW